MNDPVEGIVAPDWVRFCPRADRVHGLDGRCRSRSLTFQKGGIYWTGR